jgi:uncharacterized peroxidase-related enzyme
MGAQRRQAEGKGPVQLARLDIEQTEGRARELLEGIRRKRGSVSPLFQAMAHSPVVMSTYLSWHAAAAGLSLPVALREQISIAVSAGSGCGQCVSAHTRFGREAGLSDAELAAAQDARSEDPLAQAALDFARRVRETDGHLTADDFAAMRAAGLGDAAMVDVAALVAMNLLTNFVNNLAKEPAEAERG